MPMVAALLAGLLAWGALPAGEPKGKAPQKSDEVAAQVKELRAELARLSKDFAAQLKAINARLAEAVQTVKQARAESQRWSKEAKLLTLIIEKREEEIRKARDESANYHRIALSKQAEARTALERSQNLIKALQLAERHVTQLQEELARLKKGGGQEPASPFAANPPPQNVKGRALKVSGKNPVTIEVSLGTDDGLKKGHTLEVYRLKPRPVYLGRIQIINAAKNRATGRLLMGPQAPKRTIEVGDEVASRIR